MSIVDLLLDSERQAGEASSKLAALNKVWDMDKEQERAATVRLKAYCLDDVLSQAKLIVNLRDAAFANRFRYSDDDDPNNVDSSSDDVDGGSDVDDVGMQVSVL